VTLDEMFEQHRGHLHAVAYRMLGSATEADDAVQEAWLRLARHGGDEIENLGGWLTTVTARICLNLLQARTTRRAGELDEALPDPTPGPEDHALLGDSVGLALLVVLDALTPDERLAFVLHDTFAVPFDEIATVLGKSPAATRQLASRARRKVRGAEATPDPARSREVVTAFLAASREGDFAGLLALLAPDAVLHADATVAGYGAEPVVLGADGVARTFNGRAQAARLALLDGEPGAAWTQNGTPRVVFAFTVEDGLVTRVEMRADRDHLAALHLELLEPEG
jgi:RNA polymerase sigma factor (sigma-70 family)